MKRSSKKRKKNREKQTVLALAFILLATLAAAQTGLTLYDDSNIDANSNNITELRKLNFSSTSTSQINNFFDQNQCTGNDVVQTVYPNGSYACVSLSSASAEGLADTLDAGNYANGNNIKVNGSAIVNLTGNNITNVGEIQDFFSDACNEGEVVSDVYDNGTLQCTAVSDISSTEGLPATLDENNTANQNIDLNNNNLTDIEALENFFAGACGDGEVVDQVYANGSYKCASVDSISSTEGLPATLDDNNTANQNIDLNGNNITDLDTINTGGNQLNVDGELNLSYNNISSIEKLQSFFSNACDTGEAVTDVYNNGTLQCKPVDDLSSTEGLNATLNINNTANTSIDLNNNNLTDVEQVKNFFADACDSGEVIEQVYDNGSYQCTSVDDATTAENLSETLSAGNDFGDNNMDVEDRNITSSSGNVTIGTDLKIWGDLYTRGPLPSDSLSDVLAENNTADQKIDLNGNNLTDVKALENFFANACDSGETVTDVYDNGTMQCKPVDDLSTTEGLNATLAVNNTANTSIDLNNNNLTDVEQVKNFFADACDSGEVIEQVYDNGSYQCTSVDDATTAENLSETLGSGNSSGGTNISMTDNTGLRFSKNGLLGSIYSEGDDDSQLGAYGEKSLRIEGEDQAVYGSDIDIIAGDGTGTDGIGNAGGDVVLEAGDTGDSSDSNDRAGNVYLRAGTLSGGNNGKIFIGEDVASEVNIGADLNVSGQNISNIGNLEGFFDSACNAGETVTDVYDNGTLQCKPVDDLSSTEGLNATLAVNNTANTSIDLNNNNLTDVEQIKNFFDSACDSGETVTDVYDNGTLQCTPVGDISSAEGLPATLEANNTANQSIDFDSHNVTDAGSITFLDEITIGSSAKVTNSRGVAIGVQSVGDNYAVALGEHAEADAGNSVAIGGGEKGVGSTNTQANNEYSIAIGSDVRATSKSAIAIGGGSRASGQYSTAVGRSSSASSKGAVGIGYKANAPNQYEATFGNLNGEELDVNVTGNLTVHGSAGLNFTDSSAEIQNFFGSNCGDNEAVKRVYENGTYVCTDIVQSAQDVEGLNETLEVNNTANQSIDLNGNNITDVDTVKSDRVETEEVSSTNRMCIGDRC